MNAERRSFVLRAIYALCLLGATYNHAVIVAQHGFFWGYGGVPRASALFWSALTVLDPAAALLLFLRPNLGVAATAAIIIVDVIHNVWLIADAIHNAQVIAQFAFMVFVLATAALAWKPPRSSPQTPAPG
jgi:hypothetical protein